MPPSLGCKREAPGPAPGPPLTTLGPVSVRDVTAADEEPAHVDAEALSRALRARLLATGQFAPDAPDAGALSAVTRVDVQITLEGAEVEDKGVARARVLVHLETRPASAPGAISERLEGAGERRYDVPRR